MRRLPAIAAFMAVAAFAPLGSQMLSWGNPSTASMDDFRFGVQAFNRGRFNNAILSFEKSLSQSPDEPLIPFWLASAYSRSGFEATAADQLKRLILAGKANPFVLAREEALSARLEAAGGPDYAERLVQTGAILNVVGQETAFRRPSWLSPAPGGQYWISSFGSNKILRMDMNGVIVSVVAGPLGGFDRPFSVLSESSGGIIVSEFGADRVTRLDANGRLVARFGSKGRGDGQFMGPQYLCADASTYLYVSDIGNRRVSKFGLDGSFVLSFGKALGGFEGFSSPAGIAIAGGTVYVADTYRKKIYAFDTDGNFLSTALDKGLTRPEGLYAYGEGTLIIADSSSILSLDLATGALVKLYEGQEKVNRLICGMPDGAGGLIACDFDSSKILYLSEASLVYSGFDVTIMRTNADRYPVIDAEVSVRDAKGRPLRGLNAKNFYVTEQVSSIEDREEGGRVVSFKVDRVAPVYSMEFLGEDAPAGEYDAVIVVDPSAELVKAAKISRDLLETGLRAVISSSRFAGTVLPGPPPSFDDPASAERIASKLAAMKPRADWDIDAALRLAGSKLAASGPRRAVFLICSGKSGESAFKGHGLGELAAFYANNRIQLHVVVAGNEAADEPLSYLARRTGGTCVSLWTPQGLGPLIRAASNRSVGTYALRFTSISNSDYGRAYIPFAVEAYLMRRSGRDESGYFAPLN